MTASRCRVSMGDAHWTTWRLLIIIEMHGVISVITKHCLPLAPGILRDLCTTQRVHDWVASLEGVDAREYDLASSFPRVVFTGAALAASLAAHGLTPQAVLLVQPRDS